MGGGPVRLDVPDTAGRYYVLQFVDAWTNNFAYVGARATGTGAGTFLLVPPGWEGEAPAGQTVIRLPTAVVSIVGRWAVDGDDDLPAVAALQSALALTPTGDGARPPGARSRGGRGPRVLRAPAGGDGGVPAGRARRAAPGAHARDRAARAGIALRGSRRGARRRAARRAWRPTASGWRSRSTATPAPRGQRLEADVPPLRLQPRLLRGRARSTTRSGRSPTPRSATSSGRWRRGPGCGATTATRPPTPPSSTTPTATPSPASTATRSASRPRRRSDAFWSITMYDVPDYYLVENAIDRYSIGDRTPGLVHADDGSLTITMQRDAPADRDRPRQLAADARGPLPPAAAPLRARARRSSTAATCCRRSRGLAD